MDEGSSVYEGGCTCRTVRYRMTSRTAAGVGTLDEPDRLPPEVHIFTSTKQPWVVLPSGTPAATEYYRASDVWRQDSLERRAALVARTSAPKA